MKVLKKKKNILRGVALFCVVALSLSDVMGHRVVHAKDAVPSETAVKRDVPKTSIVSEDSKVPETSVVPDEQTTNGGEPGKQSDGVVSADGAKKRDSAAPADGAKQTDAVENKVGKLAGPEFQAAEGKTADSRLAADKAGTNMLSDADAATYASDPANNQFDLSEGPITISDAATGNLQVSYGRSSASSKVVSSSTQITIITSYSTGNNVEIKAVNSTVNLTISNLNMMVQYAGKNGKNAINLQKETKVNLTVSGTNSIEVQSEGMAAIHVPGGASLTIGGNGSLSVITSTYINPSTQSGFPSGAGIGGNSITSPSTGADFASADSGTIIINSGTITATGDSGAGIGAGAGGIARDITINGGTIEAKSKLRSAGIGGGLMNDGLGNRTANQYITINAGNVTARSVQGGAAIGGGDGTTGGYITIKGGIVEVPQSAGENAIGAGKNPNPGGVDSFTTGGNGSGVGFGNAVILLSKQRNGQGGLISDMSHKAQWGGIIFLASEGRVYSTPDITESFDIPTGYNLTIMNGESITNHTNITIKVDGTILNRGTITGSTNFINNGRIDNFGTMTNSGDVTISSTGVIYNGSDAERGTALIQNIDGSNVEVEGNVYNYARIENSDPTKVTGSGNIFNLCSMSVEIAKNGQAVSSSNPVHYGDQISVKMKVKPGPYVNFPQWQPEPVKIQYKLWNGTTEAPLTATQTTTRNVDGTAEITQTIDITRTDTIPWEGEIALKVGATMENVGGLQGYIGGSASGTVSYNKEPINMSQAVWSSGSFVYDGNPKSVEITGLPAGVTSTYTDNIKTEPGKYKAVPTLAYDTYNHKLVNMPAAVTDSLTNGYPWKIDKAVVNVTSWPAASELTDGQALSSSTLTGGAASVAGSFAWKEPAQIVSWKENQPSQEFDVEFTPTDTAHYETVLGKAAVKVNPVYYQVTFDPKGGSFAGDTTVTVQKGKPIPNPPSPTYGDGNATFAGWYVDEAYTKLWNFDTDTVTGDMTLYAKYTASNPVMLVAIPSEINIVNNMTTQKGEGSGTVKVQAITDPNIKYPDKTLTITANSKIVLNGVNSGAHINVQVYDGNDSPYDGRNPLMSFVFAGSPPAQGEQSFSLKTPIDFEKPADTYQGIMQFQLELQ